jgi:hypothetical protein
VAQETELSVPIEPTLPADRASAVARTQLTTVTGQSAPLLAVLATGSGRLIYESMVTGTRNNMASRLHVYVDAHTAAVAGSWDEVSPGVGNSR